MINMFERAKINVEVYGIIHSEESKGKQKFLLIERITGRNEPGREHEYTSYIALTQKGVKCSCIYNCFTGLYYADDIYGIEN